MYGAFGAMSLVPEAAAARAKLKSADSGMRLASRLMDMLGMAAFPPDSEQNLTYLDCTNFAVSIPVWRRCSMGAAANRHAVQPAWSKHIALPTCPRTPQSSHFPSAPLVLYQIVIE